MSIPPWIVAIFVLVAACFIGTSIINSFKLFPNEIPTSLPMSSPFPSSEGWQNEESEDDVKEESPALKTGLDQNISSSTTPLAYSVAVGSLETENDKILQDILPTIRSKIGQSSTIPKQENLDLISGGPNESATQVLVQEHQPNLEKIAPHQQLPKHTPQMVANVPTDQGTEAEQIQSNSYATRSVRQNIREEEPLKEESFANPFRIRYTKV
jgi:hypothetical protein